MSIKTRSSGASPTASNARLLFLTNIRSSQQDKEKIADLIKQTKVKMRGLPFMVRYAPPLYCRRQNLAIIEYRERSIYQVVLSKIRCNSWVCPNCSVIKAVKARYLIRSIAEVNKLNYFLTLTLDPYKIPPEFKSDTVNNTHEYITTLFNILLTNLRRKLKAEKEKLKYIWVVEFQKNGNAHLHILLNKFLDINYVREVWVRNGGGRIMKAEPAESIQGLSFYLSDYIVKGLKHDILHPSYFKYFQKRYSISQSCLRAKQNSHKLFENFSKEDKKRAIKELNLDWVYNALENEEFKDKKTIIKGY